MTLPQLRNLNNVVAGDAIVIKQGLWEQGGPREEPLDSRKESLRIVIFSSLTGFGYNAYNKLLFVIANGM